MSVTGFPTGIKLGGSAPAGETSDGKIYIYDSSDSLVATITFNGNFTIPDDVTLANETSGFSITQHSVKLTVSAASTLAGLTTANVTGGFTMAQNSKTVTIKGSPTISDETTGFSITQNGVTLTIPQNLNLAKAAAPTTALTTITCSDPGTPDYDITNLTQTTPYGFASADEGQTVLTVIKNLQTRLAELESKLQTMGLLAT